jgi:hypothetical protein
MSEADKIRFWSKVEKKGESECWPWKEGRKSGKDGGYGLFTFKGTGYIATRIAYYIYFGEDPSDRLCCHRCDTPSCTNPSHLFLGTVMDNNRDKISKGRDVNLKGEKHPMAKMTEKMVSDIRHRYASGESATKISNELNIGLSTITRAITYKNWNSLKSTEQTKIDTDIFERGSRHHGAKLTEELVLAMRAAYKSGQPVKDIAHSFGIHQSATSRIVHRKRWTHI